MGKAVKIDKKQVFLVILGIILILPVFFTIRTTATGGTAGVGVLVFV